MPARPARDFLIKSTHSNNKVLAYFTAAALSKQSGQPPLRNVYVQVKCLVGGEIQQIIRITHICHIVTNIVRGEV